MKRCTLNILSCGHCKHPEFLTRKNGSFFPANFPSLVGVIHHPDRGVILFDTGYDNTFFEATKKFPERLYRLATPVTLNPNHHVLEQLKNLGYTANDVTTIILSHFHGDHVAGLHHFPHAHIICSKRGLETIYHGTRFKRARNGILSSLIPLDIEKRVSFFEDGKTIRLSKTFYPFIDAIDILNDNSIYAIELPGHCPGHWGLALLTENNQYVFLIADAAWSIAAVKHNNPPPKLVLTLLGDTKKYYDTLNNLNILNKNSRDVLMIPSHCQTSINRFKK